MFATARQVGNFSLIKEFYQPFFVVSLLTCFEQVQTLPKLLVSLNLNLQIFQKLKHARIVNQAFRYSLASFISQENERPDLH